MAISSRHGWFRRQGLTPAELTDIEGLAQLCNTYETLDLKLNWTTLRTRSGNETNDFLYYEHGLLVAYLALFCFNTQEAEVSGMVHPTHRRKGLFTSLLDMAKAECQQRRIPEILLIVEQASQAGQAFAKSLGVLYDHSEYKMALEEIKIPFAFNEHLHFRMARAEDIPALAQITAISFDMIQIDVNWYIEKELENVARRYYVALLNDVPVGKLDVSFEKDNAFIYGFGVLPEYRGRGYGRQILAETIQAIVATGKKHISLEVATENKNALSLYQSCGFRETGSYDYYRFRLPVV